VFHLPFEPKGAAACTVSESKGIGILLNSKNVRWRRNFDLAHELFHVLTWAIFQSGQSQDVAVASPPEESFANVFASRLLMPTDALRLAIGSAGRGRSLTPAALFDVARQFDVSVEALLWRLKPIIRDLDEDKIRRMVEVCQSKASILEERERDDPPTRPARFVALAMKAFSRGEISKGVLAEYLGISRQEVMRLVERESLLDEEITLPPA
jgi:XRE family transcriptional regulator, fatty acid utilization regulator